MALKKYSERKRDEQRSANNETLGIVLIIVSAFLLLCLVAGKWILGAIGAAISGVLLGAFGYFMYPVLLFTLILGILKIKNMSVTASAKLIVAVAFAVLSIVLIAHLASSAKYLGNGFSAYLGGIYAGKNTVGGVIFGILTYLFYIIFKTVFSYIIFSIALLAAIALICRAIMGGGVRSVATAREKRSKYIEKNSYSTDPFSSSTRGGLFVGTIIKPENRNYEATEGSFDDIPEEEKSASYEPELSEDEYRRKRAREVLFGDRANFSFSPLPVMPANTTATPSVPSQKTAEQPSLPKVAVPPQKYFEHKYVEGEIINGDALSEELNQAAAPVKSDDGNLTEPISSAFASYSVPAKPVEETDNSSVTAEPDFTPGPIINGDFFVAGEELPIVEEPQHSFVEPPVSMPDAVTPTEEPAPTVYAEPDYEVEAEPDDEPIDPYFSIDAQPEEKPEPVDAYYSDAVDAAPEEEEESAESNFTDFVAPEFDNAPESPVEIPDDFVAADNTDNDDNQDDFDALPAEIIDDTVLSDEEESVIITPDTEPDELTAEEDEDGDTETFALEEKSEFDDEAKKRSDAFESSTTSFIIDDEVEDLSETGFSNPDDTTGYYNKIDIPVTPIAPVVPAPTAFETRVKEIENKINAPVSPVAKTKPVPEQLHIDSISATNAQKRSEAEQKSEKPAKPKKPTKYVIPPIDLLVTESTQPENEDDNTQEKIDLLEESLEMLGVPAKVNSVTRGPAITRFEMDMPPGMSVKRIENLSDDIRYNLASKGQIRIESPIPGKRAVGIEVPNDKIYTVALKDIIGSPEFKASSSPLTIALGKDIQGKIMITRLEKMPHLLIAGATGSGKSSCLNSLLISLMYKASPNDVRLILIDPKRVEFTAYNGLPHMLIENAITDVKKAINAFKWACEEMERRYIELQTNCVRDIGEYNSMPAVKEGTLPKMHYIVIIVDELANLMMSSKTDRKVLEESISQLASKARAAGIHLVLATQRPSVDVITGTIKANLPSRIAFAVSTMQDSRIILDSGGAEALLGRGDMLFAPLNESEETRIQGAFVENFEVKSIVDFVKTNNSGDFDDSFESYISPPEVVQTGSDGEDAEPTSPYEKELIDVVRCVINSGKASSALIQRRFRFGWNKAARIMDQMEELHFVGPQEGGAKSREIYITPEKFEEFFGEPL